MTTWDYIHILQYELQVGAVSVEIDEPTILTALNESAQRLFPVMLAADDTLFTNSQAYGSGTAWAYSSFANFFRFRAADAGAGILMRPVSFEEYATMQYSTVEQGSTISPVFKVDPTGLTLSNATAGTMYAITSFGEIKYDTSSTLNLNTDLTAADTGIISWAFEDVFLLGALKILVEREAQNPAASESDVEKLMHIAQETKAMLDMAYKPAQIFHETKVTPKIPPTRQQMQNGQ